MHRSVLTGLTLGLGIVSASNAAPITFNETGSIVQYTIPASDNYTFTAIGAAGGNTGGLGAEVGGTEFLTAGTVLDLLVGGRGGTANNGGGGGGGTLIVLDTGPTALLVAGGGGGGGAFAAGGNATLTNSGTGGGSSSASGGGGGYAGNGADGAATGGRSYLNGGAGGSPSGGFGGGGGTGSSPVEDTAGGGGGYSGGNAGGENGGLGGGSYISPSLSNVVSATGIGTANGSITITELPEPAGLSLCAVTAPALLRRRRAHQ